MQGEKKSLQTAFMTCCGFHLEQLLPILEQGTKVGFEEILGEK